MKYLLMILILAVISFLAAQELKVDSYLDKTKIGTDDYLKYTIEISGEEANRVSTPQLPDIKGFKNLGTSSSTSSSVSIINGRMQSEYTQSYTYTLAPQAVGTYLIPPVSINYKKQIYTTSAIKVEVVQGSTEPAPPTSGNFNQRRNNTSENLSDNLFLQAKIRKTTFFQNEAIVVDYTLYTRYDISNLAFGDEPNFNGFWKEDAYTPNQVSLSRENYNGTLFNTMLMKTIVLFPTQTGKMQIPSLEVKVDIRTQPRSFFDFGSTKQYSIRSEPLKITVQDLPETDKPAAFTNAVGTFNISSKISTTEMKVGDSFTYTLEVSGSGNLYQFDVPKLPEIQHLRFLDPEITTDINANKISGKKTIKYLVIAQEKGTFTIPAISFSYFDVNRKDYVTKKTPEYTITVGEGTGSFIPSSTAQSSVHQEGKDIGFIIRNTNLQNRNIYFDSFVYWFIFLLLILLIPISTIYANEQEKLHGNIDYLRQKQAAKILKRYMKQASECQAKGIPGFYAAAQTGLSSYLADKLRSPRGSTTEHIMNKLNDKQIENQLYVKIQNTFEKCNQARFMPGGFSKQNIDDDYKLLQEIVVGISKLKL
ncbi:MAG: BatD family protein [Candidatus Cloacimonadales bacterium]|nr:BatD family protein [Candidatus Cloacimonadales bacterium]